MFDEHSHAFMFNDVVIVLPSRTVCFHVGSPKIHFGAKYPGATIPERLNVCLKPSDAPHWLDCIGGAAALGCLVTGSGQAQAPTASHPAPLVQVSSWRTTALRATYPHSIRCALEIRTEHYVWTLWSPLGLSCDIVSSPVEAETCDLGRMDKTGGSTACDQMILQHPRWG